MVTKPWGREIWFAEVPKKYMGKVLVIFVNHQSSLHYHRRKEETIYVAEGFLTFVVEEGGVLVEKTYREGEAVHIKPGTRHSLKWHEDPVRLQHRPTILFEVSTYHPNDSVRVEDYYGREVAGGPRKNHHTSQSN